MSTAIAIVGFMGAGKSTVGAALARQLSLAFVDTDNLIAALHGPIETIFAQRGERGFRELELQTAVGELERVAHDGGVVSLGGGAVTISDVREALSRLAHVVWLDVPVEILYRRSSGTHRPLACDEAGFRELFASRRPLYARVATITIAFEPGRKLAETVDVVARAVAA